LNSFIIDSFPVEGDWESKVPGVGTWTYTANTGSSDSSDVFD